MYNVYYPCYSLTKVALEALLHFSNMLLIKRHMSDLRLRCGSVDHPQDMWILGNTLPQQHCNTSIILVLYVNVLDLVVGEKSHNLC